MKIWGQKKKKKENCIELKKQGTACWFAKSL